MKPTLASARSHRPRHPLALIPLLAVVLAACSGGLLLPNPPLLLPTPPAPSPTAARPADPVAVELPRDDGPHDRLTEWWYYTGHLRTDDGARYGFEAVIFRAERGDVPVTWASHLALTDESGRRFSFGQRSEIGPQVDRSPRDAAGVATGFDLAISGGSPLGPGAAPAAGPPGLAPWELAGSNGNDTIRASLPSIEATGALGFPFDLDLELSAVKRPALHDEVGWVPFGPAGGSYYYSRTRLSVDGTLAINGQSKPVTGLAWFDHQWGDFISVGGGWDWFAVNLDDGHDFTISFVRNVDGSLAFAYGTLVDASGASRHLDLTDIGLTPTGEWASPTSGARYPSGWKGMIRSASIEFTLVPTLQDQELDTRATTGVVYWEGSQTVTATVAGRSVSGDAYVELTGYARALAPGASSGP